MPENYCSVCTSVRYWREPSCADCGAPRPTDGWAPLSESDDQFLGRTVDRRFFVTRRITHFGQAALYRVSCLTVTHDFALWVCPVEAFDCDRDTLLRRMTREVGAQRRLDQPNVVPIHEFLELPNGCAAVVMDYVDGPPLRTLVAPGIALDVGRACELAAQLARALREAHSVGLIHRQLIPHNIIVEQTHDGTERVRLLNFGLSRLVREADEDDARHFFSPEQGRGGEPDQRSNIYSLGALLFFMLSGLPPSSEWNTAGTWGVRRNRAPRLSKVRGDSPVPAPLEKLVYNLLNPKPPHRPGSLSDVVPILELYAIAEADDTADGLSDADDDDFAASPHSKDLFKSGNYFNLSEQTSVFSADAVPQHTTGSVSSLSLSKTMESRLSVEELPDDLDPRSSVTFWQTADQRTDNHTWVNTATPGVQQRRRPSLPPVVCSTRATDGSIVAVDEEAKLWSGEALTFEDIESMGTLDEPALTVAANAEVVLVGQANGRLVAVERDSGKRRALLETIDRAAINAVEVGVDGNRVVAAAESGRVYVGRLDAIEKDDDWSRVRSKERVEDVAVAVGAQTLGVLRANGVVELRQIDAPHGVLATFDASTNAHSMALSPDGQLVAVITVSSVHLHHGYSGQLVASFDRLSYAPITAYFGEDNDLFGICQADGELVLWNLATNSAVEETTAKSRRR
ncbi:protein kinase domain-containing protein [Persicimonas caeni]|nr:serine/threonine-protein kinase [Persicimonas caeni]